jgi:predicted AAA+ superfamily ATPase
MFERALVGQLVGRMREERHFIQIVVGPRQTGKTTAVVSMLDHLDTPYRFVNVDDAIVPSREWLRNEWELARLLLKGDVREAIVVIDEVQKIPQWPTIVKALWDEDTRKKLPLKVVLSGSSSMLLQKGMEESLMGRFEVLYSSHWSLKECQAAFGYTLEEFLFFGGYPAAAILKGDLSRWMRYMSTSVIEPTISQDVLAIEEVRKPALLRALFNLGIRYSAHELSYTKVLGQLQDAGNTVTLAHYLDLLDKAGMLCGLQKFSQSGAVTRKSSPRFMVYDTSLLTSVRNAGVAGLPEDAELRGQLLESAVGACLLARSKEEGFDVFWWRERDKEVDFVVQKGQSITAIEVKSGRIKGMGGSMAFLKAYPQALAVVVSAGNIEDFLLGNIPLFK